MQPSTHDAATDAVPVTVENFIRAETDLYFATFVGRGARWFRAFPRAAHELLT